MAKHLIGCTLWSLRIPDTVEAIRKVAELGLQAVQFTFQQDSDLAPAGIKRIKEALMASGLKVPGGMVGFAGEDYSTIAAIRRTGGFVDAAVFPERLDRCRRWGDAMAGLGMTHVTTHAGFLPEPGRPDYAAVRDRLAAAVDALHESGLTVGLETGQESGAVLISILKDLARPWLSVNFDPANLVLYGAGDPVAAARALAGRVSMMHAKDGTPSDRPGETWGEEVPLGQGKVDFRGVIAALENGGFNGALIIEREAGTDRAGDILAGCRYLDDLLARP